VISVALRTAFTALGKTRACLIKRGLRVVGGPVLPSGPFDPGSPDGELIVGSGADGAFIAFYGDAQRAQRLEPAAIGRAKRFGGQVERRGAVTVVWVRAPASGLRSSVDACALR
jgi:hypothetical protein